MVIDIAPGVKITNHNTLYAQKLITLVGTASDTEMYNLIKGFVFEYVDEFDQLETNELGVELNMTHFLASYKTVASTDTRVQFSSTTTLNTF